MNKKLLVLAVASSIMLLASTPVFAIGTRGNNSPSRSNASYGCSGAGYGLMWDADGNFLSQKEFEAALDKAIAEGDIPAQDRDFYMDMYKRCTENSTGTAQRGCGGGGCRRR